MSDQKVVDAQRLQEIRDPQDLVGECDAYVWAATFNRLFLSDRHGPECHCGEDRRGYLTSETMIGWFANAIMAGYDLATNRLTAENIGLRDQLRLTNIDAMQETAEVSRMTLENARLRGALERIENTDQLVTFLDREKCRDMISIAREALQGSGEKSGEGA